MRGTNCRTWDQHEVYFPWLAADEQPLRVDVFGNLLAGPRHAIRGMHAALTIQVGFRKTVFAAPTCADTRFNGSSSASIATEPLWAKRPE